MRVAPTTAFLGFFAVATTCGVKKWMKTNYTKQLRDQQVAANQNTNQDTNQERNLESSFETRKKKGHKKQGHKKQGANLFDKKKGQKKQGRKKQGANLFDADSVIAKRGVDVGILAIVSELGAAAASTEIIDDFESAVPPALPTSWTTSGDENWETTYTGCSSSGVCAKSGYMEEQYYYYYYYYFPYYDYSSSGSRRLESSNGRRLQSSYLSSTLERNFTFPNEGTFAFDVFCLSESCCDYCRFYAGGVEKLKLSGTGNQWTAVNMTVNAGGEIPMRWSFTKDSSIGAGSNEGMFIDNIRFTDPPTSSPTEIPSLSPTTAPTLSCIEDGDVPTGCPNNGLSSACCSGKCFRNQGPGQKGRADQCKPSSDVTEASGDVP